MENWNVSFRDDMNEFYRRREKWIFGELRHDLTEYVHYRNHIRGHLALGGKPSITRSREQDWFALPSLLGQLEEYACYRIRKRTLDEVGALRALGRTAVVDYRLRGQEITLYENLKGLLAVSDEGRCCVLRNYRKMYCGDWGKFPHHDPHFRVYFSQLAKDQCPKLLPALTATGDETFNHKMLPCARKESRHSLVIASFKELI